MERSWQPGTHGPFVRLLYLPRFDEIVKGAVYGHTIVALPEGFIGWLAFWSVGLPSPILSAGKASKVHSLIMFFSLIGGIQFLGLIVIVAGPLVVAVAVTLLETYRSDTAALGPIATERSEETS